jgi:(2R)-sulfolactate sulfo-lyase subunit alpha
MIQFIVHDENDSVGVITVENLKANDTLTGWIMDQDKLIDIKINQDIPIGHKVAIREISEGGTVIKYGTDIGRTISNIASGDHLHVHNVKTKRW